MNQRRTYLNKFFILLVCISIISTSLQMVLPYKNYTKIAHRGDVAMAPENTMAAFHSAVKQGFDVIELDIHLSKDKKIVVIHDATVDRTTDGEGLVGNMTANELQSLDAGSWYDPKFTGESVPLLQEVLTAFAGKVILLIEIKPGPESNEITQILAKQLRQTVSSGVPTNMLQVQSFHLDVLQQFKQSAPMLPIGLVLSTPINLIQLYNYQDKISFLSIHYSSLTQSFIQQAKHYGYSIYAWTIADQSQFIYMQWLGVDGIISNDIERRDGYKYFAYWQSFIKGQSVFERFFV